MAHSGQGKGSTRVVVLGGGYAGVSCVIELRKRMPRAEILLVDGHADHCKITHLQKTLRQPASRFCVPYHDLAKRFHFEFHRKQLPLTPEMFSAWQKDKHIDLGRGVLEFDHLVICTGSVEQGLPGGRYVFGRNDLRNGKGPAIVRDFLERCSGSEGWGTVVGGGATGLQMMFALHEELGRRKERVRFRLVDYSERLLPDLPAAFHDHVTQKLSASGIEYLPATKYLGQSGNKVRLEALSSGERYSTLSDLTLLFPGVVPNPAPILTNAYGQVRAGEAVFPDLFAAGDCAQFDSPGLNRMTAQAALRKGKLVARNIQGLATGRSLQEYRYREQGYFVGLGRTEAIGWFGVRGNVVRGWPAAAIKEALECQYDLFLKGLDTYFRLLPNC